MKILLAPSEGKNTGGSGKFEIEKLLFGTLNNKRSELLKEYDDLISEADQKKLAKLFGLKKQKEIESNSKRIFTEPVMKSIQRYSGVAFDYLEYDKLNKKEQTYVDSNVIIFSNLFGPILASDKIPEYKLKQGESIEGTKTEKVYLELFE